jgi:hypothetical protein
MAAWLAAFQLAPRLGNVIQAIRTKIVAHVSSPCQSEHDALTFGE